MLLLNYSFIYYKLREKKFLALSRKSETSLSSVTLFWDYQPKKNETFLQKPPFFEFWFLTDPFPFNAKDMNSDFKIVLLESKYSPGYSIASRNASLDTDLPGVYFRLFIFFFDYRSGPASIFIATETYPGRYFTRINTRGFVSSSFNPIPSTYRHNSVKRFLQNKLWKSPKWRFAKRLRNFAEGKNSTDVSKMWWNHKRLKTHWASFVKYSNCAALRDRNGVYLSWRVILIYSSARKL